MNNRRNIIPKNNCNFCAEIKYIIKGDERIIREKSLWSLNLTKTKKRIVIKFNWDPKFSDLKIDDNKSRISVFDNKVNSKFWIRSTLSKPSLYIVAGMYWYIDILSASDNGKIEIKNKLKKTKIINFSSFLNLKRNNDFKCLKFIIV